jgi:hypothetical protein
MNIQVLFSPLRGFYIRKNRKPWWQQKIK